MSATDSTRLVRRTLDLLRSRGAGDPSAQQRIEALRELGDELVEPVGRELERADPGGREAHVHLIRALGLVELLPRVERLVLEAPATLEAKEAALSCLEELGDAGPAGAREAAGRARRAAAGDLDALEDLLAGAADRSWGRAAVASWLRTDPRLEELGGLLGRDEELDLLLLEHLGSVPRPEAAALIQQCTDSDHRAVAKAAGRALHRLRSRGVDVPEERRSGEFSLSIEPDVRGETRAWRTGVDGNGARIVWVLTPSPSGGHRLLEAVVDDERGIRRAHLSATSRKAVREHLGQLREEPSLLLAPAPPARVAAILEGAERLARQAGEMLPTAYLEWRAGPAAELFEEVDEGAASPAIRRHLDPDRTTTSQELLEAAVELLGDDVFANWAHVGSGAERAAARVREAEESRLAVDDEQRKELVEAAVAGAADDFDPELRRRYRRRLESMASLLWETGRREDARKAVAAAVGFTEVDALYERHPFARALIQRGVFVAYQRRREGGAADGDTSRIIRP